jgi:L-rhamnose mutarotase
MIRKAFVMQVNPDAHEEYQRRHNPIWPELEAVLKATARTTTPFISTKLAICCLRP